MDTSLVLYLDDLDVLINKMYTYLIKIYHLIFCVISFTLHTYIPPSRISAALSSCIWETILPSYSISMYLIWRCA